jgi:hypothetical protein
MCHLRACVRTLVAGAGAWSPIFRTAAVPVGWCRDLGNTKKASSLVWLLFVQRFGCVQPKFGGRSCCRSLGAGLRKH